MFLKPYSGKIVHDPDHNDVLPADGRNVEPHQYWLRRIEDGDVFEATLPVDKPVKVEKDKG
jgi:hypothetical protein